MNQINRIKSNQVIFIVLVLFCLSSCKQRTDRDVERISIPLRVVTDDMLTTMPGTLLVYDKELVWIDAVSDGAIHIIDKENGKEKEILKLKGEGPDEVISPDISWAPDNTFSVFDRNGAKQILVYLDHLVADNKYKRETKKYDGQFFRLKMITLKDNKKLFITPDSLHPFLLVSDLGISPFGEYPLKEVGDIHNRYDVFQGALAYNPYTGKLLHSIGQLSYMALYQWDDSKFVIDKVKTFSEVDYTVSEGKLRIINTPQHAPSAIAITKDYIVSIDRDREAPSTIASGEKVKKGRPFSKAPHTLFVYDYDLNLIKIVDIGMPVFRIAAAGNSNEVYLMGVNPEFCIATVDLP